MNKKIKKFTLIEVLIALSILSMAVGGFVLMMGSASKRTRKAAELWQNTHLLTQAVEYYMLNEANSVNNIDERFFPADEYIAECYFETPQGLPEGVEDSDGGNSLTAMRVIIKNKEGKTLDSVVVERIIGGLDK